MSPMPHPGDRVRIKLDRHANGETRDVIVKRVHVSSETMLVQYPGTAPRAGKGLFGDVQEDDIPWDAIVEVLD